MTLTVQMIVSRRQKAIDALVKLEESLRHAGAERDADRVVSCIDDVGSIKPPEESDLD